MSDGWTVQAKYGANWVLKDRAQGEHLATLLFLQRTHQKPDATFRLVDDEGTVVAESNVPGRKFVS